MSENIGGVKIPEMIYPTITAISTVYIDTDFLENYVDVLGIDSAFPAAGTNDIEKQSAVYRAQVYIESLVYQGHKYDTDQILQWPRSEVFDRNGFMVDSDQVPYDIFNACAEAAYLEYNTIGVLQPQIVPENLTPKTSEEVRAGSVGVKTSYDTSQLSQKVVGKIGGDLFMRLQGYLGQWLGRRRTSVYYLERS